jgi:predicted aspartyl protease
MKIRRFQRLRTFLIPALLSLANSTPSHGAVALDPLGRFLTGHGYGGAQLVHPDNYFRVPINLNGHAGDLTIDTGAPMSLIFRGGLGKLGLKETPTKHPVHGAFGTGNDYFGLTTIRSLTMGNCTLVGLTVAVAADREGSGFFRRYGSSSGLLGLGEMAKYGAVLDLGNRLIFLRPSGSSKEIGQTTRSILVSEGYTPINLIATESHLYASGAVNGAPCNFIVDTGAFVTLIDRGMASTARIGGLPTGLTARGLGMDSGDVAVASFPTLRIGNYEIKNASAVVAHLNKDLLGRGTKAEAAGLLGAEYLGMNRAVFDFNSKTLYLKAKPKQ